MTDLPLFPEVWDSTIRSSFVACQDNVECYPYAETAWPIIYNINLEAAVRDLPASLRNKIAIPDNLEACWLWKRSRQPSGYGQVRWNGTTDVAHRVIYKLLVGPISKDLHLDHLCQEPGCCNPNHLEPVTFRENLRRGRLSIVDLKRQKTHCDKGHLLDGKDYRGRRHCTICQRQRWKMASRKRRVNNG